MRFSNLAAFVAFAATASAANSTTIATASSPAQLSTTTVTQIVSTLTTYCSTSTTLSVNGKLITVTAVSSAKFYFIEVTGLFAGTLADKSSLQPGTLTITEYVSCPRHTVLLLYSRTMCQLSIRPSG